MDRVYTKTFSTEGEYEEWHYNNYDTMNGIKECGLSFSDDNIVVEYINVRG